MALVDQIKSDLNEALKIRDEVSVSALRFLISKLENARIEKGDILSDEEVEAEIAKDAKRHKESIAAYESAGREELARKEEAELNVLLRYLPEQLGESKIEEIVDRAISETGAASEADMGRVMRAVMTQVKGVADGSVVSKIVRGKLSG